MAKLSMTLCCGPELKSAYPYLDVTTFHVKQRRSADRRHGSTWNACDTGSRHTPEQGQRLARCGGATYFRPDIALARPPGSEPDLSGDPSRWTRMT